MANTSSKGTLTGIMNNGATWTYTGGILNGKKHGKGKFVTSDGIVYEGDWVNDKQHGKGKFKVPDGADYEGDYANGQMHGKGKLTFPDGSVYEGGFVKNNYHGKGKFVNSDGNVYEGDWVDNNQHGKGKLTLPDGSIYVGDFVRNSYHGKGKMKSSDGEVYEGDFVEGKRSGKGKLKFPDGSIYEGDFVGGLPHGKGKMTQPDGTVYKGDFINGKTRQEAEKERYNDLVQQKNNASTEDAYEQLAKDFREMGGYENSSKMADECDEQFRVLKEKREEHERKVAEERRKSATLKNIRGLSFTFVPIIVGVVLYHIGFLVGDTYGGDLNLILVFLFLVIPLITIHFRDCCDWGFFSVSSIVVFWIAILVITFNNDDHTFFALGSLSMIVAFIMSCAYPKDEYWE